MQLSEFSFTLPPELIANYPQAQRSASRLLVLDGQSGALAHHHFTDVLDFINPADLLVFNNTRVIPARLFGKKESGGRCELLVERLLNAHEALTQIRASKAPKPGSQIFLEESVAVTVVEREGEFYRIHSSERLHDLMEDYGHMPLPPYITRADEAEDKERYQTVYASQPGAVAAPTAGLHFDDSLLQRIKDKGVAMAEVTLHVGAGTFQPVRVAHIEQHQMHSEWLCVSEEVCQQVRATKARGGRVIAVGTTSVRSLESAAQSAKLQGELIQPFMGDTQIFIYPGYEYLCVDAMITNFHLPESTLLMLVSAFASRDHVLAAYQEAITERYRFFSYGDAMLITRPYLPYKKEC